MTDQTEIIQKFKKGLEPYIKPREQVNFIRRVLALHLGTCSQDGPIQHPLSLVDSSHDLVLPPGVKGIFKEYVEALQANIVARRQLESILQGNHAKPVEPPKPPASNIDLLEERICLLKLHQKRESLHAVRQSLDLLLEKPAATHEFLDSKHIFQGSAGPPRVPSDVINGLVVDQTSSRSDLSDSIHQLEKTVLKAKLLLKQEEQALRDAKAKSNGEHDVVSNGARLEALNATRSELIGWIETELGKASPEDFDEETNGNTQGKSRTGASTIEARLGEISNKYAKYVAARKLLLDLGTQKSQPLLSPPAQRTIVGDRENKPPAIRTDYLLTPYLGALVAISVRQKAIISHKTFINSILGKQNQDDCQLLGRLGEESHLLPAYPMKDSLRRRSGIQHEIASRSSEQPDIANRIKPWVFAADSAKIATLEYVAEAVEGGQLALENFMSALRETDSLLGQDSMDLAGDIIIGEPSKEDVGTNRARTRRNTITGEPSEDVGANRAGTRKHTAKKQSTSQVKNDIWARLHGNLGLLGQEDVI